MKFKAQRLATHLANVVFREENVPGCQITMNELFPGEILHAQGNLGAELEQALGEVLVHHFTRPARYVRTIGRWLVSAMKLAWLLETGA